MFCLGEGFCPGGFCSEVYVWGVFVLEPGQSTVTQELHKKGLHYPIQIKHKKEEGMSILKMDPISFVA